MNESVKTPNFKPDSKSILKSKSNNESDMKINPDTRDLFIFNFKETNKDNLNVRKNDFYRPCESNMILEEINELNCSKYVQEFKNNNLFHKENKLNIDVFEYKRINRNYNKYYLEDSNKMNNIQFSFNDDEPLNFKYDKSDYYNNTILKTYLKRNSFTTTNIFKNSNIKKEKYTTTDEKQDTNSPIIKTRNPFKNNKKDIYTSEKSTNSNNDFMNRSFSFTKLKIKIKGEIENIKDNDDIIEINKISNSNSKDVNISNIVHKSSIVKENNNDNSENKVYEKDMIDFTTDLKNDFENVIDSVISTSKFINNEFDDRKNQAYCNQNINEEISENNCSKEFEFNLVNLKEFFKSKISEDTSRDINENSSDKKIIEVETKVIDKSEVKPNVDKSKIRNFNFKNKVNIKK